MAADPASETRRVGAASRMPRIVIGLPGKFIREVIGLVHREAEKRQELVRTDVNHQLPRT